MLRNFHKAVLFIILPLLLRCSGLAAQVNAQDSMALIKLYNITNGNNWKNKTNWLTKAPVSTWFGIEVTGSRVTKIDLQFNDLVGTIPTALGDLGSLQYLSLDGNQLSGSIPQELNKLSDLTYLSIIQTALSGSIPASLGNLANLTWLRLSDNQLTGDIPATLGNLSNLQYLYLGNNHFTGTIPASLGNLSHLLYLQVYLNQLTGTIPASLGNLSNLQDFEVELNQLTGSIPASIGNINTLTTLDVFHNQLSGPIPASLGNHNYLNLFLQENNFTFAGMELMAQTKAWQKSYAPQANIPIINKCGMLSVSAGGTPKNNTYRWYNTGGILQATKTADSTFVPPVSGNYYVAVSNAVATDLTLHSDTVSTSVITHTSNEQICSGEYYMLSSGIRVNKAGIYNDTVHNSSGCGDSLITVVNLKVTIVSRQTVNASLCSGQYYTLPSGNKVNSAGLYNDTLRSAKGCDSVIVTFNITVNNPVKLDKQVTLCIGQQYTLSSGRILTKAGVYQDTLRSVVGGCDSIITTISVVEDASVTQLKDTLAICTPVTPKILNAGSSTSNTYLWNTGATSNTITVTKPDIYNVVVKSANGCTAYDTFHVITTSAANLILNKSIILCKGQSTLIDAGKGYQQYVWNTGSTNQVITINGLGKYWVTVSDQYNCMQTDTTIVSILKDAPSGFLPSDTTMCSYSSLSVGSAMPFVTYLWNTGAKVNPVIINKPGVYSLTVTDSIGCIGTEQMVVKEKQCIMGPFVPGAFTPNQDGKNDLFKPVGLNAVNLMHYQFAIYNQWGQTVFKSISPLQGWNGNTNAMQQQAGVYIWVLEYQYGNSNLEIQKGTVVLIR